MDRFMEALEEAVERVVVGDPLDEATEMGRSCPRASARPWPRS